LTAACADPGVVATGAKNRKTKQT